MKTLHTLRGTIGSQFRIYEGNDSGRAGFDWRNDHSYLLFLFPSREKKDGYWALEGCGNSRPWEQAEPALKEIDAFKKHRGGMIQVVVGLEPGQFTGARVKVRGNGSSYSAVLPQDGRSEFRVGPGHYDVTVEGSVQLEPYFMSYEQPKVTIEDGSCAQIQFVAAEERR